MRNSKEKSKDTSSAFLMLAFCVIALISVFTVKASIDKINDSKNLPVSSQTSTEPEQNINNEAADTIPAKEEADIKEEADDEDMPDNDAPASSEIPVVDSEDYSHAVYSVPMDMSYTTIAKDYTMDDVVFNTTLDQYMTHPGIDLEAPEGSGVNAVCSGTITKISQDDYYGMTVELLSPDGILFRYCNLSEENIKVETADTVSNGQLLGIVGTSALYESMEKPHLHLEVIKDGAFADPKEFCDFGE